VFGDWRRKRKRKRGREESGQSAGAQ